MGLFNRNEEEVDEERELEEKQYTRKKFKDLSSQNRRKRNEPPKPWGKKERLTVLISFFATVVVAGLLYLSSVSWKLPKIPRIELPDFSKLNIFKPETIVIGPNKNNPNAALEKKANEAISLFKETTNKLSGAYKLYVVDLDSGFSYGVDEKKVMEAASLIKLPVFATLYKQSEEGKINLETKYTLKESDKRAGSGSLSGKANGTVFTYRELAKYMGQQSDNTAFNIFRNILGDTTIEAEAKNIGMLSTSVKDNETSPYDIGTFFLKLWKGEIVSIKNRDEILGYLTKTIYEDWIPKGIPEVRVAHKFGREVNVTNDAGIVFADKPFILVLMSEGIKYSESDAVFPTLASQIYNIQK
jgi:beta-lactamase class A